MWSRITHSSHFVSDLLSDARAGRLVLPKFQRPFVWTDDDILLLLDSIQRKYPLGSLLLWGGWWRGAQVARERCRSFTGCADPYEMPTLVLDGQQRIQALLYASAPDCKFVWDARKGEFSIDSARPRQGIYPVWWLFNRHDHGVWNELGALHSWCHPSEKVLTQPAAGAKGRKKPAPVATLVDLPKSPEQEACAEVMKVLFEEQALFHDLRMGSVCIPEDSTLEYAREVFRRMNTSGRSMTEGDVFAALAGDLP